MRNKTLDIAHGASKEAQCGIAPLFKRTVADEGSSLLQTAITILRPAIRRQTASLHADNSRVEAKRAQEMMSRWLMNYDFDGKLNPYLLGHAAQAGGGMEGMELGYDGSRGCTAMGHDFISISIVGAEHPEADPVYVKLGEGRHRKDKLLHDAITALMEATGGRGWMVLGRGPGADAFPVGIGVACAAQQKQTSALPMHKTQDWQEAASNS